MRTTRRRLRSLHAHLAPHSAIRPTPATPTSAATEVLPRDWDLAAWSQVEAEQREGELFDLDRLAEYDHAAFLRDGYAVFPGLMKPKCQERWSAAVRQLQAQNDAMIVSDWVEELPWGSVGLPTPATVPPLEARRQACHNSQALPSAVNQTWKGSGKRTVAAFSKRPVVAGGGPAGGPSFPAATDEDMLQPMRREGLIPEYWPAGWDGFHASAVFHPDMLRLQGLLFGAQEFEFNQCQLLVRPPGWGGQHYHAHLDGSEADEGPHVGATTPGPYSQARHVIFTFVYPDGFEGNGQDGALKIVPGSHLWRDPAHCRSGGDGSDPADADASMAEGWLGEHPLHPATGEPMATKTLSLPPGSLVAAFAHLAHGVCPVAMGSPTRYGSLWNYRSRVPEGEAGYDSSSANIPPSFRRKAAEGGLPHRLAELVRGVESGY